MDTFHVAQSARVAAPASVVYGLIADYRGGHPRIIPPRYFSNLVVEEGGYGAGTRFSFSMTVLGRTERSQAIVEEPQPGRVLVERVVGKGIVTTFSVVPQGANVCDVTIATEMTRKAGLAGAIEKLITTRVLPKIYREELSLLESVALSR